MKEIEVPLRLGKRNCEEAPVGFDVAKMNANVIDQADRTAPCLHFHSRFMCLRCSATVIVVTSAKSRGKDA